MASAHDTQQANQQLEQDLGHGRTQGMQQQTKVQTWAELSSQQSISTVEGLDSSARRYNMFVFGLATPSMIALTVFQSVSMDVLPGYQQSEQAAICPRARGQGFCVLRHPGIAQRASLWRAAPAEMLQLLLKGSITMAAAADDMRLRDVGVPSAQSALLHVSSATVCFAALTEAASAASALDTVMLMG